MRATVARIYHITLRELGLMRQNPIYGFCMVVLPLVSMLFFTSLMDEGVPVGMPVGVVDQDDTQTTREMVRQLDAFQTTKIVGHYENVNDARKAIQRNEIYAFLLIPKGTTSGLMTSDQPKISLFYSNVSIVAGSMLYRDLKTIASLGSAAVAATQLSAVGKTAEEIRTFIQPIAVDLHMIGNPWSSYNVYLSSLMVPGVFMIFIFLLTPYAIGTELKFRRSRQWIKMANGNMYVALAGKLLPQTILFLTMVYVFDFYVFYLLGFPHAGGLGAILLSGLLAVLASQGFGIFVFGLLPSLRMSMSVCSLWSMMSFSLCGATYPVFAMDGILQALAWLFPLRHYNVIYQLSVFNGYPLTDAWFSILMLFVFMALPVLTISNVRKAMLVYVYIP